MATGQTLLDLMQALSPELQLQSGEVNVTQGLLVLNAAQDAFESLAAQHPQIQGSGVGTISTSPNAEYTTYPAGLLRLDGLDMLDNDNSLPQYSLTPRRERGGHRYGRPFWWNYISSAASGAPKIYWTNGLRVYWDPVPDVAYALRYYGFKQADDITAAGNFAYPDAVMLPLASFSVRVLRTGLDDPIQDISTLANDVIMPVVQMLANFNRDGAHSLRYEYNHDT